MPTGKHHEAFFKADGSCELYGDQHEVKRYVANATELQQWNNWPHCAGIHELTLGWQIIREQPTRLHEVQAAVDRLNALGLAIGLAGDPGAGKSTLQALAVHYGARMLELEDVGASHGSQYHKRAMEYALAHQRFESFRSPARRRALLVGLSGLEAIYLDAPSVMVRVRLQPPSHERQQRWGARHELMVSQGVSRTPYHSLNKFEPAAAVSTKSTNFFDVVVTSTGCAEQSLMDIATGVLEWVQYASTSRQLAIRWSQLRQQYNLWGHIALRPEGPADNVTAK